MRTLILAAFVVLCTAHLIIPNDDRVLIELYSESLCPDCIAFIKSSFAKAIKTQDIFKISDIRVYPYGNARWAKNGSTYSFTCQHGARECEGNIIEVCALNLYDPQQYGLNFIECLEENTTSWNAR
jgi:interferon gamma-inducible protein 30